MKQKTKWYLKVSYYFKAWTENMTTSDVGGPERVNNKYVHTRAIWFHSTPTAISFTHQLPVTRGHVITIMTCVCHSVTKQISSCFIAIVYVSRVTTAHT